MTAIISGCNKLETVCNSALCKRAGFCCVANNMYALLEAHRRLQVVLWGACHKVSAKEGLQTRVDPIPSHHSELRVLVEPYGSSSCHSKFFRDFIST